MLVNSAVFGPTEVEPKCIFTMPQGLYGFEEIDNYALITKQEDDVTLMWYQAISQTIPCFVVFDPFEIIEGYEPVMEPDDLKSFGGKTDGLVFLVIAAVPQDVSKTTVNLKSPIVIDPQNRVARQVILANKDYPIRFSLANGEEVEQEPIFDEAMEGGGSC
jgi:flagellar assembly factor FliW